MHVIVVLCGAGQGGGDRRVRVGSAAHRCTHLMSCVPAEDWQTLLPLAVKLDTLIEDVQAMHACIETRSRSVEEIARGRTHVMRRVAT